MTILQCQIEIHFKNFIKQKPVLPFEEHPFLIQAILNPKP
jgi:hypothetical protein